MPTASPFWLYLVFAQGIDFFGHRATWSETWLSTDPETSFSQAFVGLTGARAISTRTFQGFGGPSYTNFSAGCARLYPSPVVSTGNVTTRHTTHAIDFNPAAPEAAFRVQRVGAGGAPYIGRMCPPILFDTWYTDLPHRRHLDVVTLQHHLDLGRNGLSTQYAQGGRTYTCVIFRRKDFTWQRVSSYRVLTNPVRIWSRSRIYVPKTGVDPDSTFTPPRLFPTVRPY